MKINKSAFVEPGRNFVFATIAIAVSVFVFAYSIIYGFVSILLFYSLWLPLTLLNYRKVLGNYSRFYWVFAFALLACMSFAWSAAPSVTLRGGIQYVTTIVCALIASRIVDTRTFVSGVSIGVALVLIYSLAFGQFQYDELDGTYNFAGAFSSKNQLGFFASLGIYFAFSSFVILHTSKVWRVASLMFGLLAAYCLVVSSSATSIVATIATLAISLSLGAALMFSPKNRKIFFAAGVMLLLAAAAIAIKAGAVELLLGAFGKDTTLTGRTYLWQEGLKAYQASPAFGMGYQAYWVQGFSEAERLWDEFYIDGRSGFHFHNTYIEVLVELGYSGLVLISLLIGAVILGNLRLLLIESYTPQAHLMFGVAVLLLIRSFFEIDFIQPYTIGSFLLYYSAGQLAIPQHVTRRQASIGRSP